MCSREYQQAQINNEILMVNARDARDLHEAYSLHRQGRLEEAAKIYRRLVKSNSENYYALHFLANIEAANGNFEAAKALMRRSLSIEPPNLEFIENYAALLFNAADYDSALEICRRGLRISGNHIQLLHIGATSFYRTGRLEESLQQFDKLIACRPDHVGALSERGSVLAQMKQYDSALADLQRTIALDPRFAPAYLNIGNIYNELRRSAEGLAAFDQALALHSGLPEVWQGRGNSLVDLRRYEEALASYDRVLALRPDWAISWHGRANALNHLERHTEAAKSYAKVLEIEPQFEFAKGLLLHEKMLGCDWAGIDRLAADIENDVTAGRLSAEPFGWQAITDSERSLQACAELYAARRFPETRRDADSVPIVEKGRIRIGYSSGEFREQATSFLLVGVLEQHDATKFELYAIDNGHDDQSETRKRINDSVHRVIDIKDLSDSEAAARIRENGIDILVNLNGYFGEARMDVFARRPAPIQINFLGFPGTLGARYIDYIIADRRVLPEDHKIFFTEKVAYLPHSYQPNDRSKKIAAQTAARAQQGLPDQGFVFCCFNNNFKIHPHSFGAWMRILAATKGSVLWLLEDNAAAAANLRKEAEARGIDAARLVFAPRLPLADHLARHRNADLFLDTQPYGAHTTASDALWAGLPVLTCLGKAFAGRVAASLLHAIELPELVAPDLETYESLAIELAHNPEKLAALRQKLADNRLTTSLFDTRRFTRHIEAVYSSIYERYAAGLPPGDIDVSA
jgi:predicted O-linked N-acetylglucosamine transferase (SPINDLY family)